MAEWLEWGEEQRVGVEEGTEVHWEPDLVGGDLRPGAFVVRLAAPTREQAEVLQQFGLMLAATSRDGGHKRAAGTKPSWKVDRSHRAAIFSHLNKYEHGERVDPDSGQHPLVHLAWRALAIAWQETHPEDGR